MDFQKYAEKTPYSALQEIIIPANLHECEVPQSNTFGNNMKRLRAARSLTPAALAEKADVSRCYLQEIERGKVHTVLF